MSDSLFYCNKSLKKTITTVLEGFWVKKTKKNRHFKLGISILIQNYYALKYSVLYFLFFIQSYLTGHSAEHTNWIFKKLTNLRNTAFIGFGHIDANKWSKFEAESGISLFFPELFSNQYLSLPELYWNGALGSQLSQHFLRHSAILSKWPHSAWIGTDRGHTAVFTLVLHLRV